MRLESLVHVVKVASAISPGRRIVVLGSSSLLASYPELGNSNGPLETSFDADLLIEAIDEELAAIMREAIGKESLFEKKEGYHADTLRPVIAETFPSGWEGRLVPLPGSEALCLDPHDLAAVKIQVGRPKDLDLCATLLATKRLQPEIIEARLRDMRMEDRLRVHSSLRLKKVCEMAGVPCP